MRGSAGTIAGLPGQGHPDRDNTKQLGMSETPLPQSTADVPNGDASEARQARRRDDTHPGLPISAPPSALSNGAARAGLDSPFAPEDAVFVAALRKSGLLEELSNGEAQRIAKRLHAEDSPAKRRIDLLQAYYTTGDDPVAALRRRATDRWFLYSASDALHATQLLQRMLGVVPELTGAQLEWVGGAGGTLVLRIGDDVCGLDDEHGADPKSSLVNVHELVRGINVLLERKGIRTRLVGLLGDGQREAYLGMNSLTRTLSLNSAEYLMARDAEELINQTAW